MFLIKDKKFGLEELIDELVVEISPPPLLRFPKNILIDLKNIFIISENYEEDFVKTHIEQIINERVGKVQRNLRMKKWVIEAESKL